MANYNDLKTGIDAVIKTNGRQEISGAALNTQLKNMIAELGAGYQYMGVATPATNPGTPDANVFYLASEAGTYTNFGGIVINEGEVCVLVWNGTWTKQVTGAATADQLDQLGQEVHGEIVEETVFSETVQRYNELVFIQNTLSEGENAELTISIVTSTWTRFLFAANNSDSLADLLADPSKYREYKDTKTVGDNVYQITAPDPVSFPYIAYTNPGAGNSLLMTKEVVVRGLKDEIEDLQEEAASLQDDVSDLQQENSELNETMNGKPDEELLDVTGIVSAMTYIDNPLPSGSNFTLEFILPTENWTRFAFSKNNTGSDWGTEESAGNLYFFKNEKTSQEWTDNAPDPAIYPYLVYQKPAEVNEIILTKNGTPGLKDEIREVDEKLVTYADKILYGKKVLMLGDSITQLPRTGGATDGDGIVEYFSQYTGADTIRGGVGGSHIRARRILETTADITSEDSARAAFDVVYIVKALCDHDWTLQDAAIEWKRNNGSLDASLPGILADLKAVDMSSLNVLTIFAGTNDYANNALFNDDGETPADATNIQREDGAWNSILSSLANTYKNLSVFVFTPIVKVIGGVWCEDTTNTRGLTLSDYAENNLAAAKRFQYPGCDLFYTMGWNRYNFLTFAPDGTHPVNGFDCLARKMAGFITSNLNR